MQIYCTLFDSFYLSRGLTMYNSLVKNLKEFHLYIFAFDNLCYDILKKENLANTTIISLKEFENEELLKVKPERSKAEYCWTSTPSTIQYVLDNYNVPFCTYIDADLYFYNNPEVLENEMSDKESVLIAEHRYSWLAKLYEEKRAGRFCVQYITFKKNNLGRKVLESWSKQCIDWCYNRYEDGKFGDQKYLDVWPDKYQEIHILKNHGGGLAPWNVQQYKFKKSAFSFVRKKNKEEYQLVFYHFHFVRFMENRKIDIGWHRIPAIIKEQIYLPYINEIMQYETYLSEKYPLYTTSYMKTNSKGIKNIIKNIFKFVSNYNLIGKESITHGTNN
jgi:hypothetical protein